MQNDCFRRPQQVTSISERRAFAAGQEEAAPGASLGVGAMSAGLLAIDEQMAPVHREQYRRLAASLHQLRSDGLSIVMVASAVPGEGKTLTAANLGLTFSQSYHREVLLIDADLRRPGLHKAFGLANEDGLSEMVAGSIERKLTARPVLPQLWLLPAGGPTADPMAVLTSPRMKRVFGQAAESFEWVIVDTPAMTLLPDASLLASMVDGVLLVVRAGSTPCEAVRRVVESIGRGRIVGTVLNRANPGALRPYTGRYDEYYLQQSAGE